VTYVFRFPATIEVAVHGSSGSEEVAFADAIVKVRKDLEAFGAPGIRFSVTYREGKVIDRQVDEDPR